MSTELDYAGFIQSLEAAAPPAQATVALRALWYDASGKPDSAARALGNDESHSSKRVRAYLARKAGDEDAARRWYYWCGTPRWDGSLESEWEDIVRTVLIERIVDQAYS